jgi:hypothetical protein
VSPVKLPTTDVFEFPETFVGVTESVLVKLPSDVPQLKTTEVVASELAFTVPFKRAVVVVILEADCVETVGAPVKVKFKILP